MSIQTLDQRRAKHASGIVDEMVRVHAPVDPKTKKSMPNEEAKKFAIQAKKLPTRIIASGLGQALAFLVGKGFCPSLLEGLGKWILKEQAVLGVKVEIVRSDSLLKTVINQDSDYLRAVTAESLVYLQWINRFVDANKLEGDET